MKPNLLKILTFLLVFFEYSAMSQEIWSEGFSVSDKGIWGDEDGFSIVQNFEGITNWNMDFSKVSLSGPEDYAKTVSTSGGRFECRDINGELIWKSEVIGISDFENVKIQLLANETGSGANVEDKYLKAFYILDDKPETLFEINGQNLGNWGSNIVEQENLNGEQLQIIVYLNNHYSNDKVILDEVIVSAKEKPLLPVLPGDVVLNEVLFNPFPEGSDYVEIYNLSDKEISTNQLYLASRDKNSELTQIYSLSEKRIPFQPGTYLALSKDTNGVFPFYTIKCFECFLQMDKFPSFNNDEDVVVLLNEQMQVIDELYYTDKMHAPLLADEEGISLERVSIETETNKITNWHSASTRSGYGTPGYKNSQTLNDKVDKPVLTFNPESFSPNSDGYNDEYTIGYELEKSGYQMNVSIFDAAGGLVICLVKNEILGTSGEYKWNGEDETGQLQNIGVYVVLVEIFDLSGNVYQFKDGVVLTDILE